MIKHLNKLRHFIVSILSLLTSISMLGKIHHSNHTNSPVSQTCIRCSNENSYETEHTTETVLLHHLAFMLKSNGLDAIAESFFNEYRALENEVAQIRFTSERLSKMKTSDQSQCENMLWLDDRIKRDGRTNAAQVFLKDLFLVVDFEPGLFRKMYFYLNGPFKINASESLISSSREIILYYRIFYGWLQAKEKPTNLQKEMKRLLLAFEFDKLFALFKIEEPYNEEAEELDAETNMGLGLSMLLSNNPYSPEQFLSAAAEMEPDDLFIVYACAAYYNLWNAYDGIVALLDTFYSNYSPEDTSYDIINLSKIYCQALFEVEANDVALYRRSETLRMTNALYGDPNYLSGYFISETALAYSGYNSDKEIAELEKALLIHQITLGEKHSAVGDDHISLSQALRLVRPDSQTGPISKNEFIDLKSKHPYRSMIEYHLEKAVEVYQNYPSENQLDLLYAWKRLGHYWRDLDATKSAFYYDLALGVLQSGQNSMIGPGLLEGAAEQYVKTQQFEKAIACYEFLLSYDYELGSDAENIAVANMHLGVAYAAWAESIKSTQKSEAIIKLEKAIFHFELSQPGISKYSNSYKQIIESQLAQSRKILNELKND